MRGIRAGGREQLIKTMLGTTGRWWHCKAKGAEARRSDRDKQRRHGLDPALEIGETGCDQIMPGQRQEASVHALIIAGDG